MEFMETEHQIITKITPPLKIPKHQWTIKNTYRGLVYTYVLYIKGFIHIDDLFNSGTYIQNTEESRTDILVTDTKVMEILWIGFIEEFTWNKS